MTRCLQVLSLALISTTALVSSVSAAEKVSYDKMVARAVGYLKETGQAEDGSFSGSNGTGITSLVTTSMLKQGVSPQDPAVVRSLTFLKKHVRKDGGIYAEGSRHRNYETALAILCFTEANKKGEYDKLIKNAEKFIRGMQWDEEVEKEVSDPAFGGAGYGRHKRPDLSNTNFLIDALKATGAGPDDEAMKKALIFVSRCQNLETEHNTTPFAAKNPDGGFYYTPAAGGTSQAGMTDEGGLRSYASMTYAGLKSMIYAGVGPEDPRVVAAIKWLGRNYDLKTNPGMGTSGLFYYYHTFAKALDATGKDHFLDADGVKHDWRAELIAELGARQQKNGTWVNENSRWLEGDANLVTGYALLALSYCKK